MGAVAASCRLEHCARAALARGRTHAQCPTVCAVNRARPWDGWRDGAECQERRDERVAGLRRLDSGIGGAGLHVERGAASN
jgi:hypothetical protein